ncbi:MAG: OmpA family protein [Cyclobacteriaceae bacterium]
MKPTRRIYVLSTLLFFAFVHKSYSQDTTTFKQIKGVDIFISQSPKIIINLDGTVDNDCYGDTKGAINITPSGGFPPYKYFWSHGDKSQDVTGLAAGTYQVAVYDGLSCSDTLTIEIKQPAQLTAEIVNIDDILCYGYNQGVVDIDVTGGIKPYRYSWSNGARTQDLNGVISGEYSVLITDANNCQEILVAKVEETPLIIRSLDDFENIKCYGDETGRIDISIEGGSPPYQYNWSNGATTQDIDNLKAGDYEVTVTDAEGCTEVYTAKVEQPDMLTVELDEVRNVRCFGDEGGAINVKVEGGIRPYTYKWSNGITTQDIAGVKAGIYSVEIVDSNGCSQTIQAEITQPENLSVSLISSENVSFYGGNDGSVDIEVSGGIAPYRYKWSNGETTQDISGLVSGNYNAKVTDATGCSKIIHVTIDQPLPLTARIDRVQNIKCFDDANGNISISVEGGVTPYNFMWSNEATTEDISGLKAGRYSVVITDANNHTFNIDTVLTQPDEFKASVKEVSNISCFGEKAGGVDLEVAGGVAPYKYYWGNGMITQDIIDVPAGSYSVKVVDANRCEIELSMEITQPEEMNASVLEVIDVLCYDNASGAININVTGGVTPYKFAWTNDENTQNLSGLKAGLYGVTVVDANGCFKNLEARVTQPELLVIREEKVENIDCFENNNGLINLSITGGIAPYNFAWNNNDSTKNISNLTEGSYNVTVTDANGCAATYAKKLTSPTQLVATLENTVDNLCFGDNQGEVNINVTGGVAPYRYRWNTGATSQDIVDVKSGIYTLEITDSNGCIDSLRAEVKEAPLIEATITSTDILCNGDRTGAIDLSIAGGVAPYEYEWSNGATTQDISSIPKGQYSVLIKDANGCTNLQEVLITEPSRFIAILESETQISCYGQSTGAINVRVSGGVQPYTYEWSNGSTTKDNLDIPAGDYILKVTDANGCQEQVNSTITQPSEVKYAVNKVTNLNCFGDNGGSIDISITGGIGPYSYLWSNGATTQDLTNVPAGKYTVQISEGNGCQNTLEAEVTQPSLLALKLDTVVNVLCNGDNTGLINISVEGGVAPYKYSWSNGAQTEDIANLLAGNYSLTVTDANGCMKLASTIVKQPRPFVASLLGIENIKCNGDSTGTISLNVTGGLRPYKFEWNNGATTQNLSSLKAGNYSVNITDANGCQQSLSTVITQPEPLVVGLVSVSDVSCAEGTDGIVNISVSGGATPYQYEWSNGAVSQDLNDIPQGTYSVQVTDANGCSDASIEVTVTEPPKLTASFVNVRHILTYGLSNGAIDIDVSGGVSPYQYSWSNGAVTQDVDNVSAGNYSVFIVDAQGCEVLLNTKVNQPPQLNVSISSFQNILCNGEETGAIEIAVTGGVTPYNFEWSHGDSAQSISNVPAGDYALTVTDANGHRKVVTSKIAEPTPININLDNVNHVLCFGAQTGNIDVTVTGGVSPYTYEWSNGVTSQDLKNIGVGSYDLTVTDQNGCNETIQVNVGQPEELVARIVSVDNVKCNGVYEGAIRIELTGGVLPYQYSWSNGGRTQNLEDVIAGTYTVKISDANGCTNSLQATISEPPALVAEITEVSHNNCFAEEQGAISINVSGGFGNYTYLWSNGDSTQNIANLPAGLYDVIVRDSLGCEQKLATEIKQPNKLVASILKVTDINCFGGTEGKIAIDVEGGTSPYRFKWSNEEESQNLSNIGAGNYSLAIFDANDCSFNLSAEVTEPTLLVLALDTVQHNLCKNDVKGFVDITVSGGVTPYEYTWSNGENSEDLVNVIADKYTVVVKDANGCSQQLSTEVLEPQLLSIIVDSVSNVTCSGDRTGYIGVRAAGGVEPYTFRWDNGGSGSFLKDAAAGKYEAIVTDKNGCTTSVKGEIEQPAPLLSTIDAITDIQCYGDSTGAIYITALEGVEPYTFEWSNGATTPDITGLTAGEYKLKITQGNGCESYLEASVEEPTLFEYEIASVSDVGCYGSSEGAIDINVTGGVEPYSYAWSNGATSQDIADVRADNYSVLVSDANGCILTINATVEQPPKLQLAIDSTRNVKCCGDTSGAIFISVSGGVAPYRYEWSNGATTQDITNLALGKYTVTVTDAVGCQITTLDDDELDLFEQVVTTGRFITRGIEFDIAKSSIKPESFRVVNKIATLMKEYPDLTFRIEGHTDSDGTAESNLLLSENRAKSIRTALIKFGIAENRLQTHGWGESKPIVSNATRDGKQKNRRVEFISLTGNLAGELELFTDTGKE